MESYKIKNLTFSYPNTEKPSLSDISLIINKGEFITICGKSGCGKSTVLKHLKPVLSPHGEKSGEIYFEGKPISELGIKEQSSKIGFVSQNPDNQIVTDKVWHELAFGLESLSYSTQEIRARVAEMASFFGIQTWFHKKTTELSGGQKQLLNLAAVMVMQPSVLILDEPTSQLDPIAACDFLETISKINRELGTTVILAEHRLEEAFPISDRVIVMEEGKILVDGTPTEVGYKLKSLENDMLAALPTPMRVYDAVPNDDVCPVTVRDGRKWLENISGGIKIEKDIFLRYGTGNAEKKTVIELSNVWFRYEKNLHDVVKDLSLDIHEGEFYAIVGGNGAGKTTAVSIISGLLTPYRGEVKISDNKNIVMLPQNPQAVFVKKTVEADLYEAFSDSKIPKSERDSMFDRVVSICEIEGILLRHPYDLSGGEQQRAALAKILLLSPDILLLDEPTKGIDAYFKITLAEILSELKKLNITVIAVSHDVEFCAEYADRCGMLFDGNIVSEDEPCKFFSGKSFYTTAANRMARTIIPEAVTANDIILAMGGNINKKKNTPHSSEKLFAVEEKKPDCNKNKKKITVKNIISGTLFLALFLIIQLVFFNRYTDYRMYIVQLLSVLSGGMAVISFIPHNKHDIIGDCAQMPKDRRKLNKRTLTATVIILLVIPLTIYIGMFYLGDRKYYFISLLIIFETIFPFCLIFESRKPQAREIVVISVLCAIAVAGRTAFFMLPQFKPVIALVIISGVCFGGETGFLVGAMIGFVSNFYFGQGPWTPWQMFAFGIIGFIAGVLFKKGWLRKTRASLCIFGGIATMVIYGGIMNPASVILWQAKPDFAMILSAYVMGFPFDLIHAFSTVVFLWIISAPMIEKLDRVKIKYGLIE